MPSTSVSGKRVSKGCGRRRASQTPRDSDACFAREAATCERIVGIFDTVSHSPEPFERKRLTNRGVPETESLAPSVSWYHNGSATGTLPAERPTMVGPSLFRGAVFGRVSRWGC